jgi:hypothetical protein
LAVLPVRCLQFPVLHSVPGLGLALLLVFQRCRPVELLLPSPDPKLLVRLLSERLEPERLVWLPLKLWGYL